MSWRRAIPSPDSTDEEEERREIEQDQQASSEGEWESCDSSDDSNGESLDPESESTEQSRPARAESRRLPARHSLQNNVGESPADDLHEVEEMNPPTSPSIGPHLLDAKVSGQGTVTETRVVDPDSGAVLRKRTRDERARPR